MKTSTPKVVLFALLATILILIPPVLDAQGPEEPDEAPPSPGGAGCGRLLLRSDPGELTAAPTLENLRDADVFTREEATRLVRARTPRIQGHAP